MIKVTGLPEQYGPAGEKEINPIFEQSVNEIMFELALYPLGEPQSFLAYKSYVLPEVSPLSV